LSFCWLFWVHGGSRSTVSVGQRMDGSINPDRVVHFDHVERPKTKFRISFFFLFFFSLFFLSARLLPLAVSLWRIQMKIIADNDRVTTVLRGARGFYRAVALLSYGFIGSLHPVRSLRVQGSRRRHRLSLLFSQERAFGLRPSFPCLMRLFGADRSNFSACPRVIQS